jgi:nitrile hydratase subunit alpha
MTDRHGDHAHGDHAHGPNGEHPDAGDGHADPHAPIVHDDAAQAELERRSAAIEALLVEKGVLGPGEVRAAIDDFATRTPLLGARLVAKAWADPAFKARLLADAKRAAAEELGIDMGLPEIVALENTARVHHLIVCTLCSCYPRALLGPPPAWYKSLPYRSRAVVDPRGVMREFGLEVGPDVEVRVVDSTADMRYVVIPERPAGTEGLSEEELAALVTRDSLIGVARAKEPARA